MQHVGKVAGSERKKRKRLAEDEVTDEDEEMQERSGRECRRANLRAAEEGG